MRILLIAALLPPVFLLWKIYTLDRVEREPVQLIVRLILLGCLSAVCAAILEHLWSSVLTLLNIRFPSSVVWSVFENFIVIALSEELMKYVFLRRGSWHSPEFNFRFDGIVYAVAVSLGFAALENILYAFTYGFTNTLVRAVTSIPAHCIFGIYMGYYYGMARWSENLGYHARKKSYLVRAIVIPILLHGFYDFCASSGNVILTLIFYVYIILLDVLAYRTVTRHAAEDVPIR